MGWKGRIAASGAAWVVAGAALVLLGQPAGAAEPVVSDVVTFQGRAIVFPTGAPAAPAVIFSDQCQVVSDGEAAVPCFLTATGTIDQAGSGTATGVVVSSDGVLLLNETFHATGPDTGVGTGNGSETDDSGTNPITFTAAFRTAPTSTPNVLFDAGTIVVREQPSPSDPD
jgi:hypothetical protein